jgi:hypothetical protein
MLIPNSMFFSRENGLFVVKHSKYELIFLSILLLVKNNEFSQQKAKRICQFFPHDMSSKS